MSNNTIVKKYVLDKRTKRNFCYSPKPSGLIIALFQAAPRPLPDTIVSDFSHKVLPPGLAEKLSLSDVGLCPMARPSPPRLKANVALVSFWLGVDTSILTS